MTSVQLRRVAIETMTAVLLGTLASAAQSPSLAEVARQEQERRKTIPPAVKVLTNKDLPKVVAQPPVVAPADTSKPEAAAAGPAAAATQDQDKPKDEAWWRARITGPREQLRQDEILFDALQSRVNGLAADFASDTFDRTRIADDRRKAITELERVRTAIVDLKKNIADLEEEARRASVPPGWLR